MRRIVVGGLITAALMTGIASSAASARAAGTCVTVAYVALLDRADSALSANPAQPVAALTAVTEAQDLVRSAAPDLAPVIRGLTASPPDITDSRSQVHLLATTLALPRGSACDVDSQAAQNALHEVYSSPVFADLDQNQQQSIFERIGAVINWILSHLFGLFGSAGSIVLGLVILAIIAAFVIYRLRGVAGGRRAEGIGEPATVGDDPEREWKLGMAAAQRGEYREAIRRAFRSALLDVGGRRARLNRAWTTREMLASLSADADLLAVIAPAADSFDTAWYGKATVDAAAWEVARGRCEAVRRVARHGAGTQST